MSYATLILGESGMGKSTSMRNLDPKTTFIINVLDKPLPFKGYKKNFTSIKGPMDKEGNYYSTDDFSKIVAIIKGINTNRPEIKTLIIDDFQYVMCNEFMRRSSERGFDKFSDIGFHAWSIIREATSVRSDLYTFVLSHSDADQNGYMKFKTIGKMLDDKVKMEGMFTVCLHALIVDEQYRFLTQNNGVYLAKSPLGMFNDKFIDNDLRYVRESIQKYFEED